MAADARAAQMIIPLMKIKGRLQLPKQSAEYPAAKGTVALKTIAKGITKPLIPGKDSAPK